MLVPNVLTSTDKMFLRMNFTRQLGHLVCTQNSFRHKNVIKVIVVQTDSLIVIVL